MTETMTTLIARQQAAVNAGGPPAVQLRRAIEAHVRYHATHREHALVGNREIESLEEPTRTQVVDLRSTYEHGLRAIIEQGCAAGAFSTGADMGRSHSNFSVRPRWCASGSVAQSQPFARLRRQQLDGFPRRL